jgi:hypothetical protein
MHHKILIIVEIIFVLCFIFSAFEIINLSALHKDQVSIGYTLLDIKKNSTQADYARIDNIDKQLTPELKFMKWSAIITGLSIIFIPLISLLFPSIRKFVSQPLK